MRVWIGSAPISRIVYVTKEAFWSYLLRRLGGDYEIPADLCLIGYGGFPDKVALDRLLQFAEILRAPISFLGDIDPVDLAVFSLISVAATARGTNVRVSYLGFGGSMLETVQEDRDVNSLGWLKMGAFELALWRRLDTSRFGLEKEIGAVSVERLRSGWKLEGESLLPDLAKTPEVERRLLSML